ncbi:Glycerophosphoryl diester phosphodiesterase family-domain-containing protein [Syncephalis fuscata]|nr:Glycerophosphoryl diester phosphodiesterase family-domain-containing protein [Syncephalis fuscata]
MKFGKTLLRSQVPEWSRHYLHYKALKQLIKAASETISKTATPKIRRAHSPLLSNNPSRQRPTVHRSHSQTLPGKNVQTFESADAAVIAFFYALDRELERVNDFFSYKRTELERRLGILQEKVMRMRETSHGRRISMSSMSNNGLDSSSHEANRRISGLFVPLGQHAITSPGNSNNTGQEVLSGGEGEDDIDSEQAEVDESLIAALLETKDKIQKMMRFVELNLRGFDKILKKFDKNLGRQTRSLYMATRVKQLPFASSLDFRNMLATADRLLNMVEYRVAQRDVATRQRSQRMMLKSTEEVPNQAVTTTTSSSNILATLANQSTSRLVRRTANLSTEEYNQLLTAIEADDVETLKCQLDMAKSRIEKEKMNEDTERAFYKITTSLLTKACHGDCIKCVGLLIDLGAGALAKDDVNERTLLHKLALHGGRLPENPVDPNTRRVTSDGAAGAAYFFPCTSLSRTRGLRSHITPPSSASTSTTSSGPLAPVTITTSAVSSGDPELSTINDDPTLIELVLEQLPTSFVTDAPDIFGRRPLHYAALNGFPRVASALIHDLHRRHTEGGTRIIDLSADAWCDNEGYTPLFYAVLRGHAETVRVLIDEGGMTNVDVLVDEPGRVSSSINSSPASMNSKTGTSPPVASAAAATAGISGSPIAQYNQHYTHTPLILASRLGYANIVRILIERGANVNFCDGDNETSLHQAARYGCTHCASLLIRCNELTRVIPSINNSTPIQLNIGENYNNWTPLFIAVVEGHENMVSMLLKAGADATLLDNSGWTCYEHAVFRGYFGIAKLLQSFAPPLIEPTTALTTATATTTTTTTSGSEVSTSPLHQDNSSESASSDIETINDEKTSESTDETTVGRAYGHQFLLDQCELIITLGSSDIRRVIDPIELENTLIPLTSMMPGTSVSLIVHAANALGEPAVLDLPLRDEDLEPIVFRCPSNADQVLVQFDIVPTYLPCQPASGAALADNSSLQNYTVPIIGSQRLDMLGRVRFETMLVRPFSHTNMHINARNTYWRSISTKVIGHRGAGANQAVTGPASLQIGENTVLSFITAASLDVQLTRDLVPVIYHDWTVTETGLDIPVGKCTLEQFMSIRPHDASLRSPRTSPPNTSSTVPSSPATSDTPSAQLMRMERSMSLTEIRRANQRAKEDEHRRMLAKSPPPGKVKGNSFGTIQAPFATLQEALTQVPKTTGFNIEVKYPMVDEAEPDRLRPIDLNTFVDHVLNCVYTHAGDRNILFSSFHPDICRLLSRKQPNFPVFFLTDAGVCPMADYRCMSVQHAVRFAKSADLLGIVTVSDPVVDAPRLVRAIKETGLLLFTYGKRNNDVTAVRVQDNTVWMPSLWIK